MKVTKLTIYNADETGPFFSFPVNKALSFTGEPCNSRRNCKKSITILLACRGNWPDMSFTGDPCIGRRNCKESTTVLLACRGN
jgi:hypothetical protein